MRKIILFSIGLLLSHFALAQEWRVTGVVTDADYKDPLVGVNVIVQGLSGVGTVTDFDGRFSINVPAGRSLVFSYIGYKDQVIAVNSNTTLNVVLQSDTKLLEEMVVIGYGTMKKSDLTGAVTSIKADALQKTPASGIDQALQGRAAGVTVNANSGQPGAAATIRIRGIGTVNSSGPIFVVDGAILSDISFLSPNDIESTEILKDASATAIYGSRGANGVILVTTRKGKEGKSNIAYNTYFGVQNRWRKLDLMQRDEFAKTIIDLNNVASERNVYRNNGFNAWLQAYRIAGSPYYPTIKSASNPDGYDYANVETDWQDEVFVRNATIQNHHISIDGGTEKDRYAFSASYFNQNGTIIGSNFERFTLRLNSSHKVRSWLTFGENLSFMTSTGRNAMNNNSSPGASILSAALAMAPWDPTHYAQGAKNMNGKDLSGQIAASSNFRNVTNPFSMVENIDPVNKAERWVGDLHVEITPFKGLMLRSAVSMDLSNVSDKLFKKSYEYSSFDQSKDNFISSSMMKYKTITLENILNYNKDFGKHGISAMIGQTLEEFNFYSIGGSGAAILNPTPNNIYLSQASKDRTFASDGAARTRMFSLLSRLHYSYGSKYMATFNFRADASSKFPENLWGYFPSTALAWRISEEDFMQGIRNIDFIKIRAGWGQIGNDKINSNSFITTMFNGGPTFVDYNLGVNQQLANGATVLTYANKGGKWETTEQLNAGIDFGFFNGLLGGNIDVYQRNTKEMLLSVKAPAHVGNRWDPLANVGTVSNTGIELNLTHQNKIGKVNYNTSFNVSLVKNELTSLNGGDKVYGDRTLTDEGLALFTLWGYKYEGIYATDAEALTHLNGYNAHNIPFKAGDAKFRDISGDGIIDDKDKTDLGNPFPWLTYGLNLGADYKNFDIQLFFQGVHGNEIYNAVRERTEGKGDIATLGTQMRDVWTVGRTDGSIPNPYGSSLNYQTSSRFVESGSYLRLKNVQLGYNLPATLLKDKFISSLRVYLSANNLLTFTKYTGYDPEVGSGVDYGNYPQARTFLLGLNVNF